MRPDTPRPHGRTARPACRLRPDRCVPAPARRVGRELLEESRFDDARGSAGAVCAAVAGASPSGCACPAAVGSGSTRLAGPLEGPVAAPGCLAAAVASDAGRVGAGAAVAAVAGTGDAGGTG